MTPDELKQLLETLNLTQANFARLIGVTPRAVNLWMMEDRAMPGPAIAYARLLESLPMNLRQVELGRLTERGTGMRDGMFSIKFQGQIGSGMGMMIFDGGLVYGTDTEGACYDGEYIFNDSTKLVDAIVKVTMPPNVQAVFGTVNNYEWAFHVTTSFDPKKDSGSLQVKTSIGPSLAATYKFLRSLPVAA
jgi:DNA-binding XRE family transcriptional regulator